MHAIALFVRRDIEVNGKGPRAFAAGITGPKQM